jgi:hypothetical protein
MPGGGRCRPFLARQDEISKSSDIASEIEELTAV